MNKYTKIAIVLLLLVLWTAFSWRWYTCAIKGFCDEGTREVAEESTEAEEAAHLDE